MTDIVPLPLPNQLTNGTTADATQVMADLNAIATNVNANVPVAIAAAIANIQGGGTGQCKLSFTNSTTLTLNPFNGSSLVISGQTQAIPAGGITLSNGGLSASTLYYIYAYMNSGTMTLSASATGYTTDANGIYVLNGGSDHSLVGMAYLNGSSQFSDSGGLRFTRSWFNDTGVIGSFIFTSDQTTTSSSFTELNSSFRAQFILWNGEHAQISLYSQCSSSGTAIGTAIGINSTTVASARNNTSTPSTDAHSVCVLANLGPSSGETLNYATILGSTQGGTGTWNGLNQNTGLTYNTIRR